GVPLIESVIRNFRAAGVASLVVIVNEAEQAVVDWSRSRFADLDLEFIVKTTRSSLASFLEVTAWRPGGRMLVSTVDAWCREADFVRFVEAASRRPVEATVLAVTPLVADENPLRVDVDAGGRIIGLGGAAGDLVTAGMYLVSERVRTRVAPVELGRLREFLGWLCQAGEPLFGEVVETVVDVDGAGEVAIAEGMASPGRESDDAEILRLTGKHLEARGLQVILKTPDDVNGVDDARPRFVFLMCERVEVLGKLRALEASGVPHVNTPQAVLNTYRERMLEAFAEANVPFVESRVVSTRDRRVEGARPVWVKRADVHNTRDGDVVFASTADAVRQALKALAARGIPRAVLQPHVDGDLVKF